SYQLPNIPALRSSLVFNLDISPSPSEMSLPNSYIEKTQIESLINSLQNQLDRSRVLSQIIDDIKSNKRSILNYVAVLEPYLTSPEPSKRILGINALVSILELLTIDQLNHINVLVDFFILRASDLTSLLPILHGLWALFNLRGASTALKKKITLGVLEKIPIQSFQYKVRNMSFQILDRGMLYLDESSFDPQFIEKVIDAVYGEKDPRNLSLIFNIILKLTKNFDISSNLKIVFEAVYSYFPITYRAQSAESEKGLVIDLKNKLRMCLTSHPMFGDLIVDKLIDQLMGDSHSIKSDVYDLLSSGILEFPSSLWLSKIEKILQITFNEVLFSHLTGYIETSALEFLKIASLNNAKFLEEFNVLDFEINQLSKRIESLDSSYVSITLKIIKTISSASNPLCKEVAEPLISLVVDKLSSSLSTKQQLVLMNYLVTLCAACLPSNIEILASRRDSLIQFFSLYTSFSESFIENPLIDYQVEGISILVQSNTILSENENVMAFTLFSDIIVAKHNHHKIRSLINEHLLLLSHSHQKYIQDYILLRILTEVAFSNNSSRDLNFSKRKAIFMDILDSLSLKNIQFLYFILEMNLKNLAAENSNHDDIVVLSKKIIFHYIDQTEETSNLDEFLINVDSKFSQPLIKLFLSSTLLDQSLDFNLAQIISFVFCRMPLSAQLESLEKWSNILVPKTSSLECEYFESCYLFLSAIICGYRSNLPIEKVKPFLNNQLCIDVSNSVLHKAVFSPSPKIKLSCCQILSSMTNKSDKELAKNTVLGNLKASLTTDDFSSLDLALWVIRSLVCAGDNKEVKKSLLESFINFIESISISVIASDFGSILPILKDAVYSSNPKLSEVGVKSLYEVIKKSPGSAIDDVSVLEITPRLLELLDTSKKINPIDTRIAVLNLLGLFAETFEFFKLSPFFRQVCIVLQNTLDDPKRIVRKLAIAAKHKWEILEA
ncbi:hypothetical protein BB560_003543, partial [Smittium megazygosporum]